MYGYLHIFAAIASAQRIKDTMEGSLYCTLHALTSCSRCTMLPRAALGLRPVIAVPNASDGAH